MSASLVDMSIACGAMAAAVGVFGLSVALVRPWSARPIGPPPSSPPPPIRPYLRRPAEPPPPPRDPPRRPKEPIVVILLASHADAEKAHSEGWISDETLRECGQMFRSGP